MTGGSTQETIGSAGTTPNQSKRRRQAHRKSHTGCITCKIRRKKCDETKPACMRCTSTGRRCDGYATESRPARLINKSGIAVDRCLRLVPEAFIPKKGVSFGSNENDTWSANSSWHYDSSVLASHKQFIKGYALQFNATDLLLDEDDSHQESSETIASSSPASSLMNISPNPARQQGFRHKQPLSVNIYPVCMLSFHLSDFERHCIDFFRLKTGPAFAAYLGSSIWLNFAIKTGIIHPVVLSCMVAVGAVHRRHEYGISREAFEFCMYASELHEKALRRLIRLRQSAENGTATAEDKDAIMTSEVLLGIFRNFQGDNEEAVDHIRRGIRQLLNRPLKLIHSESQNFDSNPRPNLLLNVLRQLNHHADQLFNKPVRLLAIYGETVELPPIPDTFASMEEARDFILTELEWISMAIFQTPCKRKLQRFHVQRLLQWSVSHAETVKGCVRTPRHNRACKLMKMARVVAYMIMYSGVSTGLDALPAIDRGNKTPFVFNELWKIIETQEDMVANFVSLQMVVETYLNPESPFHYTEHDLSFDSAIGPPKDTQLRPESSAKVRHMIRYMNEDQTDMKSWPNLGVYGIAERVSGLEEHAVIGAMKQILPQMSNLVWTDITWMMEDRRLLLRYCKPDDERPGLLWTQEWWSF